MGTKHIHAEVIKAWADGEEIEMYIRSFDRWCEAQTPMWDTTTQYRVKPKEPVVHCVSIVHGLLPYELPCLNIFSKSNVKLSFDPDTLKLIKVELIND